MDLYECALLVVDFLKKPAGHFLSIDFFDIPSFPPEAAYYFIPV